MEEMLIGVTDRTILVFIPDPASTDGSGKTGLNAAALTVSFTRAETDNDVVVTDATSSLNDLTALTDAHNDWGVKEVSNTLAPGLYRLDIADAVFASGAWYAVVYVMITSSAAAAVPKVFRLVGVNALDAVRGGMTALPNAAADAAGGLPISDAGGLDLDSKLANTNEVTAARMGALTDWINGGRLDLILDDILLDTGTTLQGEVDGIQADTEDIQSRIPAALGANGNIKADVRDFSGTAGTFSAGRPEVNTSHWGGTAVASANVLIDGAITAAKIANGAIDAATFAADVDAEAAGWIWDRDATSHQSAGTFGLTLGDKASELYSLYQLAQRTHDAIIAFVGTVNDAGASTTSFATTLTQVNDFWNDAELTFTSGALTGQTRLISDFANTNGQVTLDEALTSAPANGVAFSIKAKHVHPVTQVAAAVWAEATRTLTAATNITSTGGTTVPQTGDSFARIGAAGVSLTDLGGMSTTMKAQVQSEAQDAMEAGYGPLLQRTTIATLASQTSFTLTAGSADDNAYNGCILIVQDASTAAQKCVAIIKDYTGATKTVTLLVDPGVFTIATTDIATIVAPDLTMRYVAASTAGRVSNAGTATETFLDVDEATTRLTISVDASGNRTDVVYG